jgi:NTP pyrophosphatase (non-canonical NTP hydrolase)
MQHNINDAVDKCHKASYDAGWWNDSNGTDLRTNEMCFAMKVVLIHSELSEAIEGDRKDTMDSHLPQYDTRAVELADAFIRLCDLAGAYNIDLGTIVVDKMAYNATRKDHTKEAWESTNGKGY